MEARTAADVPVKIKDENVDVRPAEVGPMTMASIRLAKGTDLGPALAGLPGDNCPRPHWGYMLEADSSTNGEKGQAT